MSLFMKASSIEANKFYHGNKLHTILVEMSSGKFDILKLSFLVNTKQEQRIKCDIGLD